MVKNSKKHIQLEATQQVLSGSITPPAPTFNAPLLTEVTSTSLQVLEEGDGKAKKVKVRGHFGNYDVATANKRLYTKELWEREIKKVDILLKEKQFYSELDHPGDGRTSLNRVAAVVTKLWLEDGKVMGEAEVLETDSGRNLQALLKAGCKVGVSSRGYGSTKPNEKGEDVVQPDYSLKAWDFVAEPAAGAYPDVFFESKGQKMDLKALTVDVLKEANPSLIESISTIAAQAKEAELEKKFAEMVSLEKSKTVDETKSTLKEEFAREVLIQIAKAKAELRDEVKTELLNDPSVAGAKTAFESIKNVLRPYILPEELSSHVSKVESEYKEKVEDLQKEISDLNLKIKNFEEENITLTNVLREAGYKLYIEQLIDGDSDARLIRKLVGDVKSFTTAEEIKSKIDAIKSELAAKREETRNIKKESVEVSKQTVTEAASKVQDISDKSNKLAEAYEGKIAKLEEAIEKALAAQKQTAIQLYAERKLTNHPKAAKIRTILESTNLVNMEDVDEIIETFREPIRDEESLQQVRARVRAATRGGQGSTALEEETAPVQRGSVDKLGIGLSPAEFRSLAGIKNLRK